MTLPANTRAALDRARNSSDGRLDAATAQTLESAIQELWANIQKQPDDYVLTRDEFALFNYFRERFRGSSVAQKAVERYWNSLSASSSPDGFIHLRGFDIGIRVCCYIGKELFGIRR